MKKSVSNSKRWDMGSEWQKIRFGDLLIEPTRNGLYKPKVFHGKGSKIVNMGELFGNPRLYDIPMQHIETTESERRRFCLKWGDLIFARRSLVADGAGRCSIFLGSDQDTVFESSIIRARPDQNKVSSLYLFYFFNSPLGKYHLGTIARQVAVAGITSTDLVNLSFSIPPIQEQHSIADLLHSLDNRIELNQYMNATLEAIAQALFKSWFMDFDPVKAKAEGRKPEGMDDATAALFPSAFTESILGPIPEGWTISEIGKEVEVVGGSTPSTKEGAYWEEGEFYWATPKDLSKLKSPILLYTERKITELGVKQITSGQLPIDTVLLSSRAPVGYIALAKVPVSINQGFIAMKCTKGLSPYFIINWTYYALEEIKTRANGTTFAEISKAVFRPIKVLVPGKSIIQSFDDIAKPIYDRIAENERSITSLINTRDLLLPLLISGKLHISALPKEAASS